MSHFKSLLEREGSIILGEKINWYPGHMHRGLKQLKEQIRKIDLFIEVRDARVPLSSRNHEIDTFIRLNQKQKIILFNKFDLCNRRITGQVLQNYN